MKRQRHRPRYPADKEWFDAQFAALRISDREAGRRFGLHVGALNRMLNGERELTIAVLGQLHGLFAPLGVTKEEIGGRAGYPEAFF